VASWRARNWHRAILAWFVLTLAIMAVPAEPAMLRTGAAITAACVPVLLAALP
jgi:hypothetical protein